MLSLTFQGLIALNFNSIKVRLKLLDRLRAYFKRLLFQFHKGTIKTRILIIFLLLAQKFQFHKGTIKTFIFLYIYS